MLKNCDATCSGCPMLCSEKPACIGATTTLKLTSPLHAQAHGAPFRYTLNILYTRQLTSSSRSC